MATDIRLLTLREAAEEMGVSLKVLQNEIELGRIRTISWGKNQVRIPAWHLKDWQEREINAADDRVQNVLTGTHAG